MQDARTTARRTMPPFAIVMCAPFVIRPVAVPPAEFSVCVTAVTMGLSGGKITVFSHRWRGFTPILRPRNSETRKRPRTLPVPVNKYMFFSVYICGCRIAPAVTKVRHKTRPTKHALARQRPRCRRRSPRFPCPLQSGCLAAANAPIAGGRRNVLHAFAANPCFEAAGYEDPAARLDRSAPPAAQPLGSAGGGAGAWLYHPFRRCQPLAWCSRSVPSPATI